MYIECGSSGASSPRADFKAFEVALEGVTGGVICVFETIWTKLVDGAVRINVEAGLGGLKWGAADYSECFMKKVLSAVAALALVAPSVASAAAPAQALSVKSAAVKPVRAAAKQGQAKAVSTPVIVIGLAAVIGGIVAIASGDSR